MLVEEFKWCINSDVRAFFMEKEVENKDLAARLADDYSLTPYLCVISFLYLDLYVLGDCYDIKPVRKEEGNSYWKIPLCDDDATREK